MRARSLSYFIAMICSASTCGFVLPASAGSVVGGSDLLVGSTLSKVESWIVATPSLGYSAPLTFTNIFDKATGNTEADFLAAVGSATHTLVIMEATFTVGNDTVTHIIGGFNPLNWGSTNTPAERNAFIFNVTRDEYRGQTTHADGFFQTMYFPDYTLAFGGGHDLFVAGDLINGHADAQSYCVDTSTSCKFEDDPNALNILGLTVAGALENSPFTIGAFEVFSVQQDPVPVPAALPLFAAGLGVIGFAARRRKRKAAAA